MEKRRKIFEKKAIYDLNKLTPTSKQIIILYPEILKCQGCNTCTMSCPQDIKVMECISHALLGEFREIAEKSFDCIMCGLCAEKCPANISPYHITLLCRRLFGRYLLSTFGVLSNMIEDIHKGKFESEFIRLKQMDATELSNLYKEKITIPFEKKEFI